MMFMKAYLLNIGMTEKKWVIRLYEHDRDMGIDFNIILWDLPYHRT